MDNDSKETTPFHQIFGGYERQEVTDVNECRKKLIKRILNKDDLQVQQDWAIPIRAQGRKSYFHGQWKVVGGRGPKGYEEAHLPRGRAR